MRGHGLFLASSALLVARVASQTSNVTTCTPLYEWSINARNQTPCLVAAFLESVCEGPVEVNTLPEATHYTAPPSADATVCRCSTVTYSLISACGGCQNRTFISWTDWAVNCPKVVIAGFLQTIPAEVVVPSWAYLNVTETDNFFNPILASLNSSESSSASASSSSTASALPSTTSTPSSTPSVTPPPSSTSQKSNAGAIAGGVVGGLVGLVAAALAVVFYLRRRNGPLESSGYIPSSFSTSPPPMQEHESGRTAASPLSISPFPYEPFPKDMSDAGTYPGSPVTSAVHTTFDTPSVSTPAAQILHRYTGSAEI